MTTYREVLDRLFAARRFGVVLGLERVAGLVPRAGLGTVVHVGGTNGKGSTAAMIASVARAAGRRVAVYSSPHLSTMRERMTIDGRMISEEEIVRYAEPLRESDLTFFEQITVIALEWIAAQAPDVTVLEVGLGGRLDATNVIDAEVACVTGVAMDHEGILGDTIAKIALEKAGIWKPGRRAVIGACGEAEAVPLLAAAAASCARVTIVPEDAWVPPVALAGAHQRRNAAAALACIDHLEALGALVAPSWVRAQGLANVKHPGRLERIGEVLLDGAHNPAGALALARALEDLPRPRTLILAVSSDKDVAAMLAPLVPAVDRILATRYQQPRAMDPDQLATAARAAGADAESAPDLATAMARAHGLTVIAGSLMLVGEARTLIVGAPTDPLAVTDPAP